MDSQLSKPILQHADEKAPTEDKRSSKWSTNKQSIKEGKIPREASENCECDSDRPDSKRPSEHLQEEEARQSPPALASSGSPKEKVSATMKCKYETTTKSPEEQEEPADENHSGQVPHLPSTRADQDGMNSRNIRLEEFLTAFIAALILYQNAQRPGPVNPASRAVPCEGEYSDWEKTSGVENDDQDYESNVHATHDDEKSPHSSDSEEKHHYSTMKNQPRASSSKQPCESVDDTFPALFDNSRLEEKSPGQEMEEESQNKNPVIKSQAPEEQHLKKHVTENQLNVSKFSRIPTEHGDETLAGKDEWNKNSNPEDISHAPSESNTAKANEPVNHDSESADIKHEKLADNQADSSDVADQNHNSATVAADKEAPSTEQNSEKRLQSTLNQAANERDQNDPDSTTEHVEESGKPLDHPSAAGSNQSNCIHQSVTETANNQGRLNSIQDPGHPQAEETEDPDEITNQMKQNPYQELYENVASEDQTPEQARSGTANEPSKTAGTSEDQLPEQARSGTQNEPSEPAVKNEPLEVYDQNTGQNNDHPQQQDHSDHESTGECYEEHPSEANYTLNIDQTEPTFEECIHDAQHVSASLQQDADSEMNICSEAAAPTVEQVLEYSPDMVSAVGRALNNETDVVESSQQHETAPAVSTYNANAEFQTFSHQNTEQATRPFPLENVTYPELEREDSDDPTSDSENPSADGFARASDLTQQHSAAGQEEDDTYSGPAPNLTQPVQQSVNGGVHWRPGIGGRVGGHSFCDPYSVRVVDLKERYVDLHCPIDAPRGRDRLPELLQLERQQVHGFAASDDTSLQQGFDSDTDSGNGNLIQDFVNRFRARQQEDQTVCALCENHLADTVLFQCHHIVVCRACARRLIQGSCCPLPACGAPVVCFVWLG